MKILATIGPTMQTNEQIKEVNNNNVFDFRLHLGSKREHLEHIKILNKNLKNNIFLDFPSERSRTVDLDFITFDFNQKVKFSYMENKKEEYIMLSYFKDKINSLNIGETMIFRDGKIKFKIIKITDKYVEAICIKSETRLGSNASCSFPDSAIKYNLIRQEDEELLAKINNKKLKFQFIILSFAEYPDNIIDAIRKIKKIINFDFKVIAKIETDLGVKNIDKILKYCDGILFGRGEYLIHPEFPTKMPIIQEKIVICV